MKRGLLAWSVVVVPLWIVMILCTHWEPVTGDGWGHFFEQRAHISLYDFTVGSYTHNNPRLGQVLTYLLFTPGPWHSIVTPVVELGMFGLLATLVLGRWPSLRRADDALLFATIAALVLVCVPNAGLMLFYRPFTGNYLFGFVVNLVFLVPYRFAYEAPKPRPRRWVPLMFVLGIASGMCNEHTGPAIVGLAAVATYAVWHRGERIGRWAVFGILGMIAGGVALYIAPGQAIRYNGLAAQTSLFGRIVERGVLGDLRVIGALALYASPALVWLGLGLVARRSREHVPQARPQMQTRSELALVAGAIAVVFTLLLSPKVGQRLYLAPVALVAAAVAGWVVAQLSGTRTRAAAWVFALGSIAYASFACVRAYHEVGPEFAARLDALEHAAPNSVLDLPRYTVHRSRWVYGDDLEIEPKRNLVAAEFSLALIRMTGPSAGAGSDEP